MCPEFNRLKKKWEYLQVMLEEDYCKNREEQVELARIEMDLHAERCDLCNGEEKAVLYWQNHTEKRKKEKKITFLKEEYEHA